MNKSGNSSDRGSENDRGVATTVVALKTVVKINTAVAIRTVAEIKTTIVITSVVEIEKVVVIRTVAEINTFVFRCSFRMILLVHNFLTERPCWVVNFQRIS